ncbi:MAG: response regulator, partial [candidate division NC10 bacterium]|nr:response regulator [candidate division NC10 bacterium]
MPRRGDRRAALLPKRTGVRPARGKVREPMPELLLSKGRVLVVDEERLVRQQLSKLIAGCGFKVEVAASAEAARKKVEGNPYDAVFLDLMLRRVGGVELLP